MDRASVLDALPAAEPRLLRALTGLLQAVDDPHQREVGDLGLRAVVAALRAGRDDARYGALLTMAECLTPGPAPVRPPIRSSAERAA